jgi:hypothetical protein
MLLGGILLGLPLSIAFYMHVVSIRYDTYHGTEL